jgi:hypothetical protein
MKDFPVEPQLTVASHIGKPLNQSKKLEVRAYDYKD